MPVRLVVLKCPKCGHTIEDKTTSMLFWCNDCSTLHTRDEHGIHIMHYEIAPVMKSPGTLTPFYMPFWKILVDVRILGEKNVGAFLHTLFSGDQKMEGTFYMYMPAVDFPNPNNWKDWAYALTMNPPKFPSRKDFGGLARMCANIDLYDAQKLADFLVLNFEAEKPGTLQSIEYTLQVKDIDIVFIPFIDSGGGSLAPLI